MTSAPIAARSGIRARRGIRVRGTVQGIGFRPTVYRLANELGLGGFVRNDPEGLWIEAEGGDTGLARFVELLGTEAPPLGRIDAIEIVELPIVGDDTFRVAASAERGRTEAAVPADAATCSACLRELFDPHDRRYRYPFINCTNCGPRYTIVRDVPYDRARTTMDDFALCPRCREEYEDPGNRRFHAEPNACPACGPRLMLWRDNGPMLAGESALAATVAALFAGKIVAVKGLGGFHLAVDAVQEEAVARLRARKRRPDKPLALMVRSLDHAETVVHLDAASRRALSSAARPIVLCPARRSGIAPSVAPRLTELGVMLPYTPLHHLLLADGPSVLVMTSGNRTEEPIARDNEEARAKLDSIADLLLVHDREIHTRADDSVVRAVAGTVQVVRRSRGFVPEPISLGVRAPSVCAVGAELKNTVCLTRGEQAYLSPHVGDLENVETHAFFTEVIDKLSRLLGVAPEVVAHDLHPDYLSTRWALAAGCPREPVQHHHAHVASCLVDNGRVDERAGPVLGVAFDGTGCGPAGDLWGGEILQADLTSFRRLAHLRPLALPGGEAAIREPWRLAAAALLDAGLSLDVLARIAPAQRAAIGRLCERAPRATGAGRWFDAVSALAGVCDSISYEGQAAIELEALAAREDCSAYAFAWVELEGGAAMIDLRPTMRAIAADLHQVAAAVIAARFHRTLAEVILASAHRFAARTVALSGGCFQNKLLTEVTKDLLEADGFEVLLHRRVPPNDGGVALGQAAVAAHRWQRRQNGSAHVSGNTR